VQQLLVRAQLVAQALEVPRLQIMCDHVRAGWLATCEVRAEILGLKFAIKGWLVRRLPRLQILIWPC
jgi:hypothetical protein